MHQKTTYEVTITNKLDQLPVPDLRDAIWSRIEGELDADLPNDDGGDTPPSSPNSGNLLRFALPGIIVIIITLFLIKANQKQKQKANNKTTPNTTIVTASPTASPPPIDTSTLIRNTQIPVVRPGTNVPVSPMPIKNDSVTSQPTTVVVVPPVTDNTTQQAPSLVQAPPPQPLKTDSVVGKKKRGVQGITDKDYRIVPKPDSSRKN